MRALGLGALLSVGLAAGAEARPFGPFGETPNQVAVGTALDSQVGTPSASRAAMFNAIDALPTAAARADALGQLSTRSYQMLPQLSAQALDARDRMLHSYLSERRSIAADAGSVPTLSNGAFNVVVLGDVRTARYDGARDRPKVQSDSRSIAVGIDVSPRNDVILGMMVGIDGTDARLDRMHPRINAFNAHIGPYASINNGKVFLDASATYSYADYKLRRQVQFGSFGDRLTAGADGDNWAASVKTGYLLRAGKIRLQPYAGLDYRYSDVGGFNENGGAAALRVAPYRFRSLRSSLGLRASSTIDAGGWAIRPTVQAEWQRELRKQPESRIEARFIDNNDLATFTLRPNSLKRDVATVSAGITATRDARTSFRLAYNGELGSDRRIHALVLSVSRRF